MRWCVDSVDVLLNRTFVFVSVCTCASFVDSELYLELFELQKRFCLENFIMLTTDFVVKLSNLYLSNLSNFLERLLTFEHFKPIPERTFCEL